jgi:hypothetical protein
MGINLSRLRARGLSAGLISEGFGRYLFGRGSKLSHLGEPT